VVPVCIHPHSQSQTARSHSAPSRLENLHTHKRQKWYEGPKTNQQADAVKGEGGETQPPVSSCDAGIYKKLDESKRQIRLFELNPGSGDELISGNLVTVELPVLPPDFDEYVFFDELDRIYQNFISAVRFGCWILQHDVDRWESTQSSLIWFFRYRLLESYHILRDAHGTPTADTLRCLKGLKLSDSAIVLQTIPNLLATALLSPSAHATWTHNLNDLIERLSAQGTRTRRSISHLAEQMETAIDRFISGGSDCGSALTSVDVPEMESFLAEVDVGLCAEFCTVSWFWGDAKPAEKMELNGRSLEVPKNAIRALSDLRDNDLPKRLWIDAVCINQNDKAERASQILLMSDIYSFANLTYVWLGNEDTVIQTAIDGLRQVLGLCQEATGSPHDVSIEIDEIALIFQTTSNLAYVPADPEAPTGVSISSANTSRPQFWM
jgi:hypothetical protein